MGKYLLILLLFLQNSFGISNQYFKEKYDTTRKLYLGSVMSNDTKKQIEYLKKLIRYGDKLHINTIKYKRELNRIDKTTIVQSTHKTTFKPKPKYKKHKKYTIKTVRTIPNGIVIEFYKNISKRYLKFSKYKRKGYYIDQFDIKGSFKDAKKTKLTLNNLDRVLVYQYKKNSLRILLKDKQKIKSIYIIDKRKIIIKVLSTKNIPKTYQKHKKVDKHIFDKKVKKKHNIKVIPKQTLYTNNKVIVIDPGHGGRDAGATNRRMYEKNVVLNIGKYLRKELKSRGFKVYMTRSNDRYIKLPHRTKYANRKKADLFISIHANSVRKSRAKEAHGIETYFLSPARSSRAKRVAALENRDGVNNVSYSTKNTILTILNQAKITQSNKLAIDIQKNVLYTLRKKYGKRSIRDAGVREAPFWVLVGAAMPSILIEVGYISHPIEGKRINKRSYQKLMAKGIADGIESYFRKQQF